MSLSDIIALTSLILTIIGLIVGIVIGWHSSDAFRTVTQRLVTTLLVKGFRQRVFLTVYVPLLAISLLVLYLVKHFSVATVLLAYSAWLSLWTVQLYRRRRNLSQIGSCLLGWPESEKGANGIEHVFYSDGSSRTVPFHGEIVRCTNAEDGQYYMYFRIRDDIVNIFRNAPSVLIGVEFFDFAEAEYHGHGFDLQYDSTDMDNPRPFFKHSKPIMFENTGKWVLKMIEVRDGSFSRRQQKIADFRVNCQLRPARHKVLHDLYVRRVIAFALNE